MKYIRLFENMYDAKYWLIPTDERRQEALKIIGCNNKIYVDLVNDEKFRERNKYVFLGKKLSWGWNPFNGELRDSLYDELGYKFMGPVSMEEWEIEAIKYNL